MRKLLLPSLLLTLAVAGCDLLTPDVKCTTELVSGILVDVVDSVTGTRALADEIIVIATDVTYADTARLLRNQSPPIPVVDDRQGVYSVDVRAEGYSPWEMKNVRVTGDECHVHTVEITARLQRHP